jgi:hypothetical protein
MNRSEAPTSETERLLCRLGVIMLSELLEECVREKYRGEWSIDTSMLSFPVPAAGLSVIIGVGRKMQDSLSRVIPGGGMGLFCKVDVGVDAPEEGDDKERMSRGKRAA